MSTRSRRAGFTLVETLATLALLCFVVAVLGPLLMRVSRQSSSVTIGQYRTAALVSATSYHVAARSACCASTCIANMTPAFNYTTCTRRPTPSRRSAGSGSSSRPDDSILSAPDTLLVYRVNSARINPFDAP